ncbi:hypothetical protein BT96DRAFT_917162 [Gymnopus androsaceus JB14]|uniref:Uncharacterized protein n=1 Tax=Gymnopus androsaceus JB14 TaxID=1447944 RepID=A0A6A4I200_9AGAR|nr:hypothetical protein BT96DRAFT_917162 [Gymnopus androsaceus JB14]
MVSRVSLASLLVFVSSAFGTAVFKRDDGCQNFGESGIANNADSFSLWAQYDQGRTFSGNSDDVESVFLAPNQSAGVMVGDLFQLNSAGIVGIGYPDSNYQNLTWNSDSTDDGAPLPFSLSKDSTIAGIAEDYCEVVSTDPNGSLYSGPLLAGEGTVDGWYICNSTGNSLQQGVVLNAADYSAEYGYNFSTCQSVHILLRWP